MLDKNNLPPFDDIISIYFHDSIAKLFPKKCENKTGLYFIGLFHLLGAMVLTYGLLLPNSILPLYLIYCFINVFLYNFVFKKQCFMTLLTNYYGNVSGSSLYISMPNFYFGLTLNMVLAIIGIIFPNLSIYRLIGYIFSA